jgi:hypothetical protein
MDEKLMIEFSQKFDGVINIITAIAVIVYAIYVNLSEKNSGLRKRLLMLFILLGSLCLLRGVNYIFDLGILIEEVVMMISSIIPLSLFLMVELLMRRHLPVLAKLSITISTMGLLLGLFLFGINRHFMMALMFEYVVIFIYFAYVLLLHKNLNLEKNEKRLIFLVSMISIFVIPMIITDFKKVFGWDTIRYGAFGILFFLYSLIRIWETKNLKSNILRLVSLLLLNMVTSGIFAYLFNLFEQYLYVLVISLMMRMLVEIFIYASDSYSNKARDMALNIIDIFLAGDLKFDEIKKKVSHEDFILMYRKELPHYNPERIIKIFQRSGLYFKNNIKKMTKDADELDEMEHLFDDFDCNACLYIEIATSATKKCERDFLMILFKWPDLAPKNKLEHEIIMIQSLATHIKG